MSDDLLNRASRALREQEHDSGQAPPGARLRVIEAAGRARKAEARQMAVVTALGMVMLASTAVAAATGHLQQAVAVVKAAVGMGAPEPASLPTRTEPAPASLRAGKGRAVALAAAATDATEVAVRPELPVQPAPAQPEPEVAGNGLHAPARTGGSTGLGQAGIATAPKAAHVHAPLAPAPDDSAEDLALLAFRSAQRLHAQHQWSAALAAWEHYLKVAPRGELAPEARWSRAQCLAQLGRMAAARAALQPFATGAEGGYHQADAAELLQALDAAGERPE